MAHQKKEKQSKQEQKLKSMKKSNKKKKKKSKNRKNENIIKKIKFIFSHINGIFSKNKVTEKNTNIKTTFRRINVW